LRPLRRQSQAGWSRGWSVHLLKEKSLTALNVHRAAHCEASVFNPPDPERDPATVIPLFVDHDALNAP
jgi:hypothetical protein